MSLFDDNNKPVPQGKSPPTSMVPTCHMCGKKLGDCKCWKWCSCTWPYTEERAAKALEFKKASAAATFLGIPPKNIYCQIGRGKYAHQKDGKKWAVSKVS